MKKKIIYLVILTILLMSKYGTAQVDFFRPGTEWYYGFYSYGLLVARGYTLYKYEGDTTIDVHLLKKLSSTTYTFDLDEPTIPLDTFYSSPRFYKQSGDSILNYYQGDLTLAWVNGLEKGDLFQIDEGWDSIGDYDLITILIDSTEDILLNGIPSRKTYIHGGVISDFFGDTVFVSRFGKDIIYDKFGPTGGFGYWTCWGSYDCYTPSLCRYVSNETGIVEFPSGNHCESLITSSKDILPVDLFVYPNPCTDYIIVQQSKSISHSEFEILNQAGVLLLSTIFTEQQNMVDVSMLPAGIYFCRINDHEGVHIGKLVKQ
jgi:hypothetical protein